MSGAASNIDRSWPTGPTFTCSGAHRHRFGCFGFGAPDGVSLRRAGGAAIRNALRTAAEVFQ
jgi:hypothetical protein